MAADPRSVLRALVVNAPELERACRYLASIRRRQVKHASPAADELQEIADVVQAARPALAALAGMCVLEVEVVRKLVRLCLEIDERYGLRSHERAALASAEEEVARVEARGTMGAEVRDG